jgi:uncharacterized protein (TIGR00369 family)
LTARPDLRQQHGYVHGGVVSYLGDNAITFAVGAALGPDIVTAAISVDYVRPAVGDLVARAWVVRAGSARAVLRCDVSNATAAEPVLCAIGQAAWWFVEHRCPDLGRTSWSCGPVLGAVGHRGRIRGIGRNPRDIDSLGLPEMPGRFL